jgi:hypothetical protein
MGGELGLAGAVVAGDVEEVLGVLDGAGAVGKNDAHCARAADARPRSDEIALWALVASC